MTSIAAIERDENAQIAPVPPAPGDEQLVAEWLSDRAKAIELYNDAFHAYARNQKVHQFRRLLGKSGEASLEAYSVAEDLGIKSCA